MTDTTFVNGTTLSDADWFNDVNRLHYTILSDPADAAAVRTTLGVSNGSTDITMTAASIIEAEGAAVASASSCNIWATDGNTRHITGTTTITDFATAPQAGAWMKIIFDGALILTHGANLNLPGGANITTAANDWAFVYADTTTLFRVTYFQADGTAVVASGSSVFTESFTSSELTLTANTELLGTAHSLSGKPKLVQCNLICKTTEYGYSVGDIINMAMTGNGSAAGGFDGSWANATNIGYFAQAGFVMGDRSTPAIRYLTLANWKMIIKAWY